MMESMNDEELLEEYQKKKDYHDLLDSRQYTLKILINSVYGACGTEYFRWFDEDLASAITCAGQMSVRGPANFLEEKTNKLIENRYADTDSCAGDTLIQIENIKIQIDELWKQSVNKKELKKDQYVAELPNIKSLSMNKQQKIGFSQINYIMKHKVKKRMFKIKTTDSEVVITEDHSLMVVRDGVLIECKPLERQKGDKLIEIMKNFPIY